MKKGKGILKQINTSYGSMNSSVSFKDLEDMITIVKPKQKSTMWIGITLAKSIVKNPQFGKEMLLKSYEEQTTMPIDEETRQFLENLNKI